MLGQSSVTPLSQEMASVDAKRKLLQEQLQEVEFAVKELSTTTTLAPTDQPGHEKMDTDYSDSDGESSVSSSTTLPRRLKAAYNKQAARNCTYSEAAQPSPERRLFASNIIRQNRREMTFTMFNATPPTITVDEVIQDVGKSLKVEPRVAILEVHKDTRFKSRFHIYFKSRLYVDQAKTNGMQIGSTTIRPQRRIRKGFIPNLPMWELEAEVKETLSEKGEVRYAEPRKRRDGMMVWGWNIGIITHENRPLPDQLDMRFTLYDIHHPDRKYLCRRCGGQHTKLGRCITADQQEPQSATDTNIADDLVIDDEASQGTVTPPRTATPEDIEPPTPTEVEGPPTPTTVQEEEPPSQSILRTDSPPPPTAKEPPDMSTDRPRSHMEDKEMTSDREDRKRTKPANHQKARKKRRPATNTFKNK